MSSDKGRVDPADAYSIDDIMPLEKYVTPIPPPVVHALHWDDEIGDDDAPVDWLIEGVLPSGVLAVLYGDPGVGKSFLALDWALSIAESGPWAGRRCASGTVVYVAAEGYRGMRNRVASWKATRSLTTMDRSGVAFLGRALRLLDEGDAAQFVRSIRATMPDSPPALIVIDTLARNAVGLEENSARDMGRIISSCDVLREQLGSTVLILHHASKAKELGPTMRGSGALKGAVDTVVLVNEKEGTIRAYCEKQKDAARFPSHYFKLMPVGKSAVLSRAQAPEAGGLKEPEFPELGG